MHWDSSKLYTRFIDEENSPSIRLNLDISLLTVCDSSMQCLLQRGLVGYTCLQPPITLKSTSTSAQGPASRRTRVFPNRKVVVPGQEGMQTGRVAKAVNPCCRGCQPIAAWSYLSERMLHVQQKTQLPNTPKDGSLPSIVEPQLSASSTLRNHTVEADQLLYPQFRLLRMATTRA